MTKAYRSLTVVPLLYWFVWCSGGSRPSATKAATLLYHSNEMPTCDDTVQSIDRLSQRPNRSEPMQGLAVCVSS